MKDLYDALTERADRSGDIPVLPTPLPSSDPRQYVLVEVMRGPFRVDVTFALNVSDANILGYLLNINGGANSLFFRDVPLEVANALFPHSQRRWLPFTGKYEELEAAAGVFDRSRKVIPMGFNYLDFFISILKSLNEVDNSIYASALIICIQTISEAVRLRNIQQEILAAADPIAIGEYKVFYLDSLMLEYANKWEDISAATQSASFGIFGKPVRLQHDGPELVLTTVRQVLFTVAMMPSRCKEASLQVLRMPTTSESALRSPGLEHNSGMCERLLAPTSHIVGQNGLCVDVNRSIFQDNTRVILWACGWKKRNQLWTLKPDNTI